MRRRKFFKLLAGLPFVGAAVCKGLGLRGDWVSVPDPEDCMLTRDFTVYTGYYGEPGGSIITGQFRSAYMNRNQILADALSEEGWKRMEISAQLQPGERVVWVELD